MNYLTISIGQAGNQINYELSRLFLQESVEEYKTIQGDLVKNVLIDSEVKVVEIF